MTIFILGYGFEDTFGEDESLTPMHRLQKYLDSDNIFNRLFSFFFLPKEACVAFMLGYNTLCKTNLY